MPAPLIFSNRLIITPALVGPVPQYEAINVAHGASWAASWAWIDQGAGMDPSTATPSAVWRQEPNDAPLLSIGAGATSSGQITFLTPVTNFPYIPPTVEAGQPATLITLYPFELLIKPAGVAALTVPYCQWSFSFTWPDGSVTQILSGETFVSSV